MQELVSAIIVHFGQPALTETVVRHLSSFQHESRLEIIVVDNASAQPFHPAPDEDVRVLRLEENRGYGHACNRGADIAAGDYLFILNNDLEFPENPIPPLLARCRSDTRTGAVGPALRFPDGRFQLSWGEAPTLLGEFRERRRQLQSRSSGGDALNRRAHASREARTTDWITGACMFIPRTAWERVRGFDERFFFYFEDADLCARLLRAGCSIWYDPAATVLHHGGGSDPLRDPAIVLSYRREQLRYYARYNGVVRFFLLQRYLLWKFGRMRAAGTVTAELMEDLRTLVRDFSREEEQRYFKAYEENRA